MSKRYEWINGETYCDSDQMYDNETGNKTQPVYVADLLNEQDQKIKDLEHQLANCIVKPKFKVNDTIFVIVNDNIEEYFVDEILLRNKGTLWAYYDICKKTEITEKNEIFATEAEAKAKLEELKNG